jgi:predicted nucleic acid-binding protein
MPAESRSRAQCEFRAQIVECQFLRQSTVQTPSGRDGAKPQQAASGVARGRRTRAAAALRAARFQRALDREPLPTPLGTLDAIHLATALVWRDRQDVALTIASHDAALAAAARGFGFEVVGA